MVTKVKPQWEGRPAEWANFTQFAERDRKELVMAARCSKSAADKYIADLIPIVDNYLGARAGARSLPTRAEARAACEELASTARRIELMLDHDIGATRWLIADEFERRHADIPRPCVFFEDPVRYLSEPLPVYVFEEYMARALEFIATSADHAAERLRGRTGDDLYFTKSDTVRFALDVAVAFQRNTGRDPATDDRGTSDDLENTIDILLRCVECAEAPRETKKQKKAKRLKLGAHSIVKEVIQYLKAGTRPEGYG